MIVMLNPVMVFRYPVIKIQLTQLAQRAAVHKLVALPLTVELIPKAHVSQHGSGRKQGGRVKLNNNRSNFDEPEGVASTMAAIVQALSDTHDN